MKHKKRYSRKEWEMLRGWELVYKRDSGHEHSLILNHLAYYDFEGDIIDLVFPEYDKFKAQMKCKNLLNLVMK